MIRTTGFYQSHRGEEAAVVLDSLKAIEYLEKNKEKRLVFEIKRYTEKRSLSANAYFWVLCDKIAGVLGSNKDVIYLRQLERYGVFVDLETIREALPDLQKAFRYVEEYNDGIYETDKILARCYIGSSHYDRQEMSRLIDGTVTDAHDLGIDTWTPEEIERTVAIWEAL